MSGPCGVSDPRYPKKNLTGVSDPRYAQPVVETLAPFRAAPFNEPPPRLNEDFSCIAIFDGLPKIPESKIDRLMKVVGDKINKIDGAGKIVNRIMPMGADGKKTEGYAFIEFDSFQGCEKVIKGINGKPLDRKHTFAVSRYSQYDSVVATEDEYKSPPQADFKVQSKTYNDWTLDDFGRDQFVLRYGNDCQVCWNDPVRQSGDKNGMEVFYDRQKETKKTLKKGVRWSPRGSFLATFHDQGIYINININVKLTFYSCFIFFLCVSLSLSYTSTRLV